MYCQRIGIIFITFYLWESSQVAPLLFFDCALCSMILKKMCSYFTLDYILIQLNIKIMCSCCYKNKKYFVKWWTCCLVIFRVFTSMQLLLSIGVHKACLHFLKYKCVAYLERASNYSLVKKINLKIFISLIRLF